MNINRPQNPLLQREQVQMLPQQRFLAKIPNTKVLREFLINTGGYYAPPLRDLTNDFCKVQIADIRFLIFFQKLLKGEKKLLKAQNVLWVENVPNWPEFSSKQLWLKAKLNHSVALYFPDFSDSRLPQR